jgi:hypothetical protein
MSRLIKTAVNKILAGRRRNFHGRRDQLCWRYLLEPAACRAGSGCCKKRRADGDRQLEGILQKAMPLCGTDAVEAAAGKRGAPFRPCSINQSAALISDMQPICFTRFD